MSQKLEVFLSSLTALKDEVRESWITDRVYVLQHFHGYSELDAKRKAIEEWVDTQNKV